MKKYRVEFQVYNKPGIVEANCNEITFANQGGQTADINGFQMVPGASLSVSGNAHEMDVSRYSLSFTGAGSQYVIVFRKCYIQ